MAVRIQILTLSSHILRAVRTAFRAESFELAIKTFKFASFKHSNIVCVIALEAFQSV